MIEECEQLRKICPATYWLAAGQKPNVAREDTACNEIPDINAETYGTCSITQSPFV